MLNRSVEIHYSSSYLCVMCTNRARASEGTVGVTLLRIREGVVFHLVVPSLNMERRWLISREIIGYKNSHLNNGNFKVVKATSCSLIRILRAGCLAEATSYHEGVFSCFITGNSIKCHEGCEAFYSAALLHLTKYFNFLHISKLQESWRKINNVVVSLFYPKL